LKYSCLQLTARRDRKYQIITSGSKGAQGTGENTPASYNIYSNKHTRKYVIEINVN
jgi:hypothetical protein